MCSLYSLRRTPAETRTLFNYLDQPDFPPRPYVAPGGPMAIVRLEEGQRRFGADVGGERQSGVDEDRGP